MHPTNTGYAIIANEFIHALNTQAAAGIPPVNVRKVQRNDPLVLPGFGHPPSRRGTVPADAFESLRSVIGRAKTAARTAASRLDRGALTAFRGRSAKRSAFTSEGTEAQLQDKAVPPCPLC